VDVQFSEQDGVYTGTGGTGRHWTVSRVFAGWRLEFRDEGDTATTYAGVHRTLQAAQAEAAR
jgi:hypothetical protein